MATQFSVTAPMMALDGGAVASDHRLQARIGLFWSRRRFQMVPHQDVLTRIPERERESARRERERERERAERERERERAREDVIVFF